MNGMHVLMFVAGMLLHVVCALFAALYLNKRTEFPKPPTKKGGAS